MPTAATSKLCSLNFYLLLYHKTLLSIFPGPSLLGLSFSAKRFKKRQLRDTPASLSPLLPRAHPPPQLHDTQVTADLGARRLRTATKNLHLIFYRESHYCIRNAECSDSGGKMLKLPILNYFDLSLTIFPLLARALSRAEQGGSFSRALSLSLSLTLSYSLWLVRSCTLSVSLLLSLFLLQSLSRSLPLSQSLSRSLPLSSTLSISLSLSPVLSCPPLVNM